MTISAQVIAELVRAGLSGEALVAAVERIESADSLRRSAERTSVDEQAERRRAADRERKKQGREAERLRKSAELSAEVSGGDRGINNNSLQEISGSEGKGLVVTRETKRGTRIPADFEPDDTVKAIARELRFTQREWDEWLAEFKDFWSSRSGRDATKTDWQATARNGIRRFNRTSRKGKPDGYNTRDSVTQAFDYIDERDARRRQDGSQANPELLS